MRQLKSMSGSPTIPKVGFQQSTAAVVPTIEAVEHSKHSPSINPVQVSFTRYQLGTILST